MSTSIKDNFDEQQWFLLSSTPSLIGAAMAGAAPSGIIGTVKEAVASMKGVIAGIKDYPENELVQTLLERAENWDDAKERAGNYRKMALDKMDTHGIKTPEQLTARMLEDCREVNALLTANCSNEQAHEYKLWALSVAEKVAHAASEGGFLGFGGEQVSEPERKLLDDIKGALDCS